MAELFTIIGSQINSVANILNVSDSPSDDLDATGANQCQARIQGTADAGTYMVTFSSTASIDSVTNAVFSRFTINPIDANAVLIGEWKIGSRAAANSGDNLFFTYTFPLIHLGGAFDIALQMYKEAASDTLDVETINVSWNRIA